MITHFGRLLPVLISATSSTRAVQALGKRDPVPTDPSNLAAGIGTIFAGPGIPSETTDAGVGNAAVEPTLEWTALGDSYAAGVGTDKYISGSRRCMRHDAAYPQLINLNPYYIAPGNTKVLPYGPRQFNNAVCSGAEADDILKWQLLDKPTKHEPSQQYGTRPAFGNPSFATLTAGGDDVDFPGFIFNCILGIHIPSGPPKRTCTDQRSHIRKLVEAGWYINDLGRVINAVMEKGRKGSAGNDFRLYVTSYARFFNDGTTGDDTNCDGTTFQIAGFPLGAPLREKGAVDARLTTDFRKDANELTDMLNKGIEQAVYEFNDPHIRFVDIQTDLSGKDILNGHRFCEKGIREPDVDNKELFLWHFPYSKGPPFDHNTLAFEHMFEESWNKTWDGAGGDVNEKYPNWTPFLNAILDNFTPELFKANGVDDYDEPGIWSGALGQYTKLFHPNFEWHKSITTSILTQYALDTKPHDDPTLPPNPPNDYATGTCHVHVKEVWTCSHDDNNNLFANIQITDDANNDIGHSDDGVPIAGDPYSLNSTLKDPLTVKGNRVAGTVDFKFGDLSWSNQEASADGKASCTASGFNDVPFCGRGIGHTATNNIDCSFPC